MTADELARECDHKWETIMADAGPVATVCSRCGFQARIPHDLSELEEPCRVNWGSHGCGLARGHNGPHDCGCCECDHHPDPDSGCVGRHPFYGDATTFYGEDA